MRRDRAFRLGPALFLFERTFEDILERIALVRRRFRSALLIGCPDPSWPNRLAKVVDRLAVVDPGALFAGAVRGRKLAEDQERLGSGDFDLCLAIGTLDTVDDLPLALANIRAALCQSALLIGAMSGGDTLPALRRAMRAADAVTRAASPHVHPRIDGPSFCRLIDSAGFVDPVVDLDRVSVAYGSLAKLVADLRAMAATNILADRSRTPMHRDAFSAASRDFAAAAQDGRTVEVFEILHFAAWTAPD